MGKWEFYDNDEEVDSSDEKEPSFSMYDFKKWLGNQKIPSFRESVEPTEQDKNALKEKFKQRVKDRVQRNIDRKLKERKKK